jgi:hypothetical protein
MQLSAVLGFAPIAFALIAVPRTGPGIRAGRRPQEHGQSCRAVTLSCASADLAQGVERI